MLQFAGQGMQAIGPAGDQHQVVTPGRELAAEFPADSGGGTGHQGPRGGIRQRLQFGSYNFV